MALIHVDLFSQELMRTVPVKVVLPVDKVVRGGARDARAAGPYKTLYLLHGIFGSCIDWVSGTPLQRWAEERDLAVVMPSGENRFYLDDEAAHACFGRFVGDELVRLMRKMFPLSDRREDTFIGGLSMGGYGALRNGLRYSETFGYVAAFSPVPLMQQIRAARDDASFPFARPAYFRSVVGDLAAVEESDANPVVLARRAAVKPQVYCACGADDSLLPGVAACCQELRGAGVPLTFEQHDGGHDWEFWTWALHRALDWLPLEDGASGVSSGNVGL